MLAIQLQIGAADHANQGVLAGRLKSHRGFLASHGEYPRLELLRGRELKGSLLVNQKAISLARHQQPKLRPALTSVVRADSVGPQVVIANRGPLHRPRIGDRVGQRHQGGFAGAFDERLHRVQRREQRHRIRLGAPNVLIGRRRQPSEHGKVTEAPPQSRLLGFGNLQQVVGIAAASFKPALPQIRPVAQLPAHEQILRGTQAKGGEMGATLSLEITQCVDLGNNDAGHMIGAELGQDSGAAHMFLGSPAVRALNRPGFPGGSTSQVD